MNEVKNDESARSKAEQLEPVVICPRCEKEVKNQEIGKARIDGELSHVKCAQEELDEIGMDDFYD